jgi:hypothetical protein
MNQPGAFAADFLQVRQAARYGYRDLAYLEDRLSPRKKFKYLPKSAIHEI